MTYLKNLNKSVMNNLSECLSHIPSNDTLIYIHIGGARDDELETALDCIFLDDRRIFRLVDIKKQPHLISALVVLEPTERPPIKF